MVLPAARDTYARRGFDPRTIGCKCDVCPLGIYHRKQLVYAPVPPEGPDDGEDPEFIFVGEEPGGQEVRHRRPMIGQSGKLLETTINRLGLYRDRVLLTNGLLCRPENNDLDAFIAKIVRPANDAIKAANREAKKEKKPITPLLLLPQDACRPHITRILRRYPHVPVVTLGGLAYWSVTGQKRELSKIRGSFNEFYIGPEGGVTDITRFDLPPPLNSVKIRVTPTYNPVIALRIAPANREVLERDIERAVRWTQNKLEWTEPKLITMHPSVKDIADFIRDVGSAVSWDLETTMDSNLENKLRTVQLFSLSRQAGIVIPWVSIDGHTGFARGLTLTNPSQADLANVAGTVALGLRPWWDDFHKFHYAEGEGREIRRLLLELFADPKVVKIGHHSNYYDWSVIERHIGYPPPVLDATTGQMVHRTYESMLDQILLTRAWNSELPRSLYFVGTMLTDVPAWKAAEGDRSIARKPRTYEELAIYGNLDTAVVAQTAPLLLTAVKRRGQEKVVLMDHKIHTICREMHTLGLYVDEEVRQQVEDETRARIDKFRSQITSAVGGELNPRSAQQLGKLLFDPTQWGLPIPLYTNTGRPSTNEDAIRTLLTTVGLLNEEQRSILNAVWKLRGVEKDLSTVLLPLRRRSKGGLVCEDGVMRAQYSAFIPATGRISSSEMNCFDGETEILTANGWVRFDELPKGLPVAQFHPEDQSVDFVEPLAYVEKDYDGPMVHVKSQQIDMFMTPNHRCLLQGKDGAFRVFRADEYPDGNYKQHHTGCYVGGPGILGGNVDKVRFLVALQADGTIRADGYGIGFGFSKARKKERLSKLLTDLGLNFSVYESPVRPELTEFYVPYSENRTLRGLVDQLSPGKAFGPWLLDMNREQLDAFALEVWHWDGCVTRMSQYSSSDRVNADWVQAILALTGKQRANLRAYDAPGLTRTNWQVDVSTKPYSWTNNRERIVSAWQGKIYCVTMPAHYIIVRRNGKVCVTGQTQNFRKKLRKIIRPRPGHLFVMSDYDQIELRLLCALAQVAAYLQVFKEGGDPHAVTALLIYGDQFARELAVKHSTGDETALYTALRRFAKVFVYAVLYGGTAETVYDSVSKATNDDGDLLFPHMTLRDVQACVDTWQANAPEIPAWWAQTWDSTESNGFITEVIGGRRRDFPIFDRNASINMPIQGGAGIIMSEGLIRLRERFPPDQYAGTGIVNQMHDAITLEVPEEHAEEARQITEEVLTASYPHVRGVTFSTGAKVCLDWAESKWLNPKKFGEGIEKTVKDARELDAMADRIRAANITWTPGEVVTKLSRLNWRNDGGVSVTHRWADQYELAKVNGAILEVKRLLSKKESDDVKKPKKTGLTAAPPAK